MLTNDEYHDILDTIKAAKSDFRYADEDFVVEAYQISKRSRFHEKEWPKWLQMQKSPTQVNRVYSEASHPNDLILMMAGGVEQPLGDTDWLVMYPNGELTVVPERDFRGFNKVVPIPENPVIPESLPEFEQQFEVVDGKLTKRSVPLRIVDAPAVLTESTYSAPDCIEVEELKEAICKAIEMGRKNGGSSAVDYLISIVAPKIRWCNCAPGLCDGGPIISCRKKSPIVK